MAALTSTPLRPRRSAGVSVRIVSPAASQGQGEGRVRRIRALLPEERPRIATHLLQDFVGGRPQAGIHGSRWRRGGDSGTELRPRKLLEQLRIPSVIEDHFLALVEPFQHEALFAMPLDDLPLVVDDVVADQAQVPEVADLDVVRAGLPQ